MPSTGRSRAVLHESPLLVGLAGAWFLCWWHGRVFVQMAWPAGFDWERYLRETWATLHPGTMNSTWLEPLYPWLLSTVGAELGWAWAGQVISSVALLAIVLGAGILGRALGGPWAGAIAALAIPLTPQLATSARWVGMYPLLSAATALGLAGLVALCRWPRWWWALLGGVGTGIAWGVDSRTIALLPGMILLALLGAWAAEGKGRRWLLLGLFAGGLALGPVSQQALRVIPREATADVAVILRGIELSKVAQGQDVAFREACRSEPAVVINPVDLFRPCAAEFQRDNTSRIDAGLPFGLFWTLWLFPLALLPGRDGIRRSLVAVLALVPPLAMTWAMSRWVIVTPRYMMQIAAPAAVVMPVALVATLRMFVPRRWTGVGSALTCLAVLAWMIRSGPSGHGELVPLERSSTYQMMEPVVRYIRTEIGPEDQLLDCSESHIEVSLLPRTVHVPPTNHEGHDWKRCAEWIERPDSAGGAYVVTGARTRIPGVLPSRPPGPWESVIQSDGMGQSIYLWRWRGG